MSRIISSTEVRKNWSETIDSVVRESPVFVKRRRDLLAFLSKQQLALLLENHRLTLDVYREEDGSYTGSVREMDLLGNAESFETVIDQLTLDLVDYADEYIESYAQYFNSPNRKAHFPYIVKVLACEGDLDLISKIFVPCFAEEPRA